MWIILPIMYPEARFCPLASEVGVESARCFPRVRRKKMRGKEGRGGKGRVRNPSWGWRLGFQLEFSGPTFQETYCDLDFTLSPIVLSQERSETFSLGPGPSSTAAPRGAGVWKEALAAKIPLPLPPLSVLWPRGPVTAFLVYSVSLPQAN